jgi:hypothetical protein
VTDPTTELHDYKGLFWDDVSKQLYRWGELQTLMQERANKRGRQWKEHECQLALSRLNMLINVITMTSIK